MRRSVRKYTTGLFLLSIIWLLLMPVTAAEYIYDGSKESNLDVALQDLLENLPAEIRSEIDTYMQEPTTESIEQFLSLSYWWKRFEPLLVESVKNVFESLISVASLLLLTAWIQQWTGSATAGIFQFCSDVCMALTLFTVFRSILVKMHTFLGQLCGFMTTMLPVMAAVQYSAGDITTAAINRISMTLFITTLNQLQRGLFLPLGQALYSLSIMSAVCTKIPISGFTGAVKKFFMTMFSMMILIYSFVYGLQNTLAASADSLGLRTMRFAIGNFIPIVGGTVSEAFSAVRTGLGYVKTMAGTGGILILCLLLLPMAAVVWSFHIMLGLTHTAAELLGCGHSVRLLADTRSILQIFSAILWLSVLFFLFAIILFTKTAGHTG